MDGAKSCNSFSGSAWKRAESLARGAFLGRAGERDRGHEADASQAGRTLTEPGNEINQTVRCTDSLRTALSVPTGNSA